MNLKQIKKEGQKANIILSIIGLILTGIGIFSKVTDNFLIDYYLYGIIPVWITFVIFGFSFIVSDFIKFIKYNISYKQYSKEYVDLINVELNDNYKKIFTIYFTKTYIIVPNEKFIILEYKNIKKVLLNLASNVNIVSVLTNDNMLIPILKSNDDICNEVINYIMEQNKSIIKCYDNIDNEIK